MRTPEIALLLACFFTDWQLRRAKTRLPVCATDRFSGSLLRSSAVQLQHQLLPAVGEASYAFDSDVVGVLSRGLALS